MIEILSLAITIAGGLLAVLPKVLATKHEAASRPEEARKADFRTTRAAPDGVPSTPSPPPSAAASDASRTSTGVLGSFAALLLLFAAIAVWRYWERVTALGDTLFLAIGLLLTMAGGMFVQVLSSNYTHDRPLFQVTPSQLLYPLLFSPIVFYPIWLIGDEQGAQLFPFYAAFLNGYFWQSVVASAKRPEGG